MRVKSRFSKQTLLVIFFLLAAAGVEIAAQSADEQVKMLRRQLDELRQALERSQREQEATVRSLKQKLDELEQRNEFDSGKRPSTPAQPRSSSVQREANSLTVEDSKKSSSTDATKPWRPTDPIRVGGKNSYLDLSLVGTVAVGGSTESDLSSLQLGGHDPSQRGFTIQSVEAAFSGAVDPYFRGQANIAFLLDGAGETGLELEEAFLESQSLPANLQLRVGQYLTEFGRHNPTHVHSWSFVDQPLVMGRFLGPDGLRNPGARLSWLVPTPFYSELFLSVQNSAGETATSFRFSNEGDLLHGRPVNEGNLKSFGEMMFAPRYAASFELTESQTLLGGLSGAFGPNGMGQGYRTEIYGADLTWKWKSPKHQSGFPFVAWQSEFLLRRFDAAEAGVDLDGDGILETLLPDERLVDYGFYSQLSYGFTRGWVLGARGEWLGGDDAAWTPDMFRDARWRVSPNLTWFPSEFSKLRLQYNHDWREFRGVDHSVWLQIEFLLGTHAAHKF